MEKQLQVWAIQDDFFLLYNILDTLKGMNIIYTNYPCQLRLGDFHIKTFQFSHVLYNVHKNLLLMLKRNQKITKEEVVEYLLATEKEYGEIKRNKFQSEEECPFHLWIIENPQSLKDTFSKMDLKTNFCEFYTEIDGDLEMGYLEKLQLDSLFQGIIKIENNLILLKNPVFLEKGITVEENMKDFLLELKYLNMDVLLKRDLNLEILQNNCKQFRKNLVYFKK